MRKILFLTPWYPEESNRFWGIFCKKHADTISINNDVFVLHISFKKGLKSTNSISLDIKGKFGRAYIRSSSLPIIGKFLDIIALVIYGSRFIKLIKSSWGKPELLHVNIANPIGLLGFLEKMFRRTQKTASSCTGR